MRDLGRIVRLQIQRASLKAGEKPGKGKGEERTARPSPFPASYGPLTILAHLVPRQRSDFLAPLADQLLHIRLEPLAVAASGTHGVSEREQAPHSLNFARLAPDDAPALGGMIPDLEEAPIDGYVAPVYVQHHDVARRDAHHGVPGTPTQQMGTGPADPSPALGLEPRRCHWSKRNAHPLRITPSTCYQS